MGLSQVCYAANIQNYLIRTAPTDIAQCSGGGSRWGNSYGVYNDGAYNAGGYLAPALACGTEAFGEANGSVSGKLAYTEFTCIHSGYYDVIAAGLVNGYVGLNVPKEDNWLGGAEASARVVLGWKLYNQGSGVTMRSRDTVLYNKSSKHTTAAPTVFSNYPWSNSVYNVYLDSGQTYACEISINITGHVGATGFDKHEAHMMALFSTFIVPEGPFYGLYFGSYRFYSASFIDKNPDYIRPVTTIYPPGKTCCSPQTITLTAVDYGSYGLDKTYYRLNNGSAQVYTVPFTVSSTTNVKYYSTDNAGNVEIEKSADYIFPGVPPPPALSINVGYTTIDLSWTAAAAASSYLVYRDGINVAEVTATTWTDTAPGWDAHAYWVKGINVCYHGPQSNTVTGACPSPYVKLTEGSVNDVDVSDGVLELIIYDGDPIVGNVTVEAYNAWEPCNTAPLVFVWGWGAHESSWSLIHNWIPQGTSSHTVPINLVAPETGGDYYLSTAFALEIQGCHVASLTNWQVPGAPHWDDGYDIADWGAEEYAQSLAEHQVTTMYETPGGIGPSTLPAAMIKLTVIERGFVSGTVADESGPGMCDIVVDLYKGNAMIATTSTDGNGDYSFEDLIPGEYFVCVLTPLGYLADCETKCAAVPPGGTDIVDFALTQRDIVPTQQNAVFWKHVVNVAIWGDDNDGEIDMAEPLAAYFDLIYRHFQMNRVHPIEIFEEPVPVTGYAKLVALGELLNISSPEIDPFIYNDPELGSNSLNRPIADGDGSRFGDSSMRRYALREFVSLLLNVVSQRLATFHTITEDDLNVGQVITHSYNLITNATEDDYRTAYYLLRRANDGVMIAAGAIPASTPDIAYMINGADDDVVPNEYSLAQNRPNPFNPVTAIQFSLPENADITISIFDVNGRRVATLANGYFDAGLHTVYWDGRDGNGQHVATGIYFYRLRSLNFTQTKKMLLLK